MSRLARVLRRAAAALAQRFAGEPNAAFPECPHEVIDELVPTIAYECRHCGEIFA